MVAGNKTNYTFEPWSCICRDGIWLIEAYSIVTGRRETVARIEANNGFAADAVAQFIVEAVNIRDKREHLINEMTAALELCLECEGRLDWSAEHDAEVALRHAKARG